MDLKEDLGDLVKGLAIGFLAAQFEQGFDNREFSPLHNHYINVLESAVYAAGLSGYDKLRWRNQTVTSEKSASRAVGFMIGQTVSKLYMF